MQGDRRGTRVRRVGAAKHDGAQRNGSRNEVNDERTGRDGRLRHDAQCSNEVKEEAMKILYGLTHTLEGVPIVREARSVKIGIGLPKGKAVQVWIESEGDWRVLVGNRKPLSEHAKRPRGSTTKRKLALRSASTPSDFLTSPLLTSARAVHSSRTSRRSNSTVQSRGSLTSCS